MQPFGGHIQFSPAGWQQPQSSSGSVDQQFELGSPRKLMVSGHAKGWLIDIWGPLGSQLVDKSWVSVGGRSLGRRWSGSLSRMSGHFGSSQSVFMANSSYLTQSQEDKSAQNP